jgi:hypothetical protein
MRSSPVDAASIDAAIKEAEDACKTGDAAEWCVRALSAGLRAGWAPRAPWAPGAARAWRPDAGLAGPRAAARSPAPANVLELEDWPAAAGPCAPRAPSAGPGSAAHELGRARLVLRLPRRPPRSPARPAPAPRSAVAWDTVEELDAARSHAQTAAKADPKASDPLEQFCADGAPRRPLYVGALRARAPAAPRAAPAVRPPHPPPPSPFRNCRPVGG